MLSVYEQLVAATKPPAPREPRERSGGWVQDNSVAGQLMRLVKDGKPWPLSEAAVALEVAEGAVKSALYRLERKGLIIKTGHRKRPTGGRPEPIYRKK